MENPIRLRLIEAAGSETGTDLCHGAAMANIQSHCTQPCQIEEL